MKWVVSLLAIAFITGCAVKVEQEEPAIIEHRINLDDIKEYFIKACQDEYPLGNELVINDCVDAYMAEFVKLFAEGF